MKAQIVICMIGAAACSTAAWSALRIHDDSRVAAVAAAPQRVVSRREHLARLVAETAARSAAETASTASVRKNPGTTVDDTRLASSGP